MEPSEREKQTILRPVMRGRVLQLADGTVVAHDRRATRLLALSGDQIKGRVALAPAWRLIAEDGSPFAVENHPATICLRTGRPTARVAMGVDQGRGDAIWIVAQSLPLFAPGEAEPYAIETCIVERAPERHREEPVQTGDGLERSAPASVEIIARFDRELRPVYVSHTIEQLTGLAAASLVGKTAEELGIPLPTHLVEFWRAALQDVFEAGQETAIDFEFAGPHDLRWYRAHIVPERDKHNEGPPETVLANVRDITDEEHEGDNAREVAVGKDAGRMARRAERELRASEERFRSLSACSPVGIFVTNTAGRCTYMNARCQALMGLAKDARLGSWWAQIIHPDERVSVWRGWLGAVRQGGEYARECRFATPDGRERNVYIRAAPIRSSSGELLGQVGTAEDITERKRAEEQIRFQASLLEAVGQSVIATDLSGRIRYWNSAAERLYGWSPEEAIGRDVLELTVPPAARPYVRTMIVDRVLSNHGWAGESVVTHRDGRLFPALCTISPIYDENRRVAGMVGTAQDISDRKKLEDELRRQAEDLASDDRRKDEFLSMLAHELRNPLASILHAVEAMRLREENAAAVQNARGIAERQVRHMARLLDDLLDVSRIRRGVVDLRIKPVNLCSAASDAVKASRPLLEARKHHLSITLPEQPVWIEADPDRIEQVITNLVNNAAKYTEPGGHIQLSIERADPGAFLRVRDTGVGIDPDLLPRIFDLFIQGSRSHDRAAGGLGIGLTLARRLVELHGGTLEAHSSGIGHGSEFVVRLPRTIAAPASDVVESAPAAVRAADTKRRVLVVEDNHDGADTLADLLRLRGHEVVVAYDGRAALEAFARFHPEVVLMDIGLPEMDGYEVARRLSRRRGHERPLLVAMTGYGQEKDRSLSREAGFDYHLVKPVSLRAIEDVLRQPATPRPPPRERVVTARFP